MKQDSTWRALLRHGAFAFAAGVMALGCAQEAADPGTSQQSIVSGAAFTTDNIWVDGDSREICQNSSINCNIYGAKEFVWLNGGPAANGLGPDGDYFFAVLAPGGQPDPNDGGANNLSDDFDAFTNRTFTVSGGEVASYSGTHDLDSGNFLDPDRPVCTSPQGCAPDGEPPLIRLAPYADTTNPGGVYILAICSLADGYPVEPRDCKYDAFKVKEKRKVGFWLSGMKYKDTHADGVCGDAGTDPGLPGWTITIQGTGFQGEPIDESVVTGYAGYWSFSKIYELKKHDSVWPAELTICEVMQENWYQTFPATESGCYDITLQPWAITSKSDLDFGNVFKKKTYDCSQ